MRAAERLRWKAYSRLSQTAVIAAVCLITLSIGILAYKNSLATPPCPCNVFTLQSPATQPGLYNEAGGIEVGFKFKVDRSGYISGVRFYKVAGMSGTHTASLWSSIGNRLATATFTSESAAGWQEITFAPIAVVADRPYIASVFMADGNYVATPAYFTAPIVNTPFIIPENGNAWDGAGHQGQGVYDASGTSAYPFNSFNANNYWIDTVYVSSPSVAAPTITAKYPAANATNVTVSDALTATFDKRLDPATVSTDTFTVADAQGTTMPGSVSYDPETSMATFIPDALLQTNATYTLTLRGGLGQVITDFDGHHLGADYQWSFTTSSIPLTCPCSLKNKQAPTSATTYRESYPDGLELGVKIVPKTKGYIQAIRFYKPIIQDQMSHVGHVWDGNGNNLATVVFSDESDYGWQEATLTAPLNVLKDHVYIISFGITTAANYIATINGLASPLESPGIAAYPSGESRNAALGSGMANSVYAMTAGVYPASPASSNQDYMIDAVFSLAPNEEESLKLIQTQPSKDSYGIKADTAISANLSQALDPSTVTSSTVYVRNAAGVNIPGQVSYDASRWSIVFHPTAPLAAGERYTATVTASLKSTQEKYLPETYSWSFTVGSSPVIDMNQGKGGPILVVTSSTDNYSKYYAEILRTEGITYFDVRDLATLSPAVLSSYKAVILSQMSLTDMHVDMLQSWVSGGGNLIAMRPDKKLSSLLGLEDAGGVLTNSYLGVDTGTSAGLGIVSETMQYKGTADKYTVQDATLVGRLYIDKTTETSYAAVTTRSVGAGTAMSFSYDLAKSVIGLHQGNPAWQGQDRNGDNVRRTNDLFYGAALGDTQPDWLDVSKMDIPQADEQQRLLVNFLTSSMKKSLPTPRFWYLPHNQKAALVLAGDDHGLWNVEGTEQQLNHLLNVSPVDCSIMDWECVRATHYVYSTSELTNARARQFMDYGFEIGAHPVVSGGSCDIGSTYDQFSHEYAASLSAVRAKYTSLPYQTTARYHCYAWPSWDWMPRVDYANGIRYDLNTVAYPASWVGVHSPMVTSSGMNMRLTDTSGSLLDVRQGVTNFDNTTASASSIAAMLDNALGVKGYYGIFGSHYDMSDAYEKTLYTVASSRQIPIITADQALTWLDGKAASNFTNLSSTAAGKLTFTVEVAEGASGLQGMMPMQDVNGTLSSMTRAGQPVPYQTELIKGVQYARFKAEPGPYEVTYSDFGISDKPHVISAPDSAVQHAKLVSSDTTLADSSEVSSSNQVITPTTPGLGGDVLERSAAARNVPEKWWQMSGLVWTIGGVGVVITGGGLGWLLKIRRR